MASPVVSPSKVAETAQPRDALASLRIERPDTRAPGGGRPRRRRWLKAWLLLVVIGLIGGGSLAVARGWRLPDSLLTRLGIGGDWVPAIIQNRPEVRLIRVTVQTGRSADAIVVATGYLESRRQAKIGARAPGRIDKINFEEGSVVKQGDVLAILEHADIEAAVAAVKAQVTRAQAAQAEQEILIRQSQREMERAESLWKRQGISEAEYDKARFTHESAVARRESLAAEVQLAVARHKEAEQLRDNMFIRAPFDGTVISKDGEVGESILPGGMGDASGRGSVATIADLQHLEIECDVKEDFINRVSESQPTEIAVDAVPGRKYHGQVRKIIPMGDRARATIKVQVAILDADGLLFPEMSGTVYFLPTEESAAAESETPRFFCPATAVTTGPDGAASLVWTVDSDERARSVDVSVGERRDESIEILSGLTGQERVIVNPQGLTDGQNVKVIE